MTYEHGSRSKKGSGVKKLLAVSATAVVAGLAATIPALAATPPQLPHDITIFPQRDFVAMDGYAPNTSMLVSVRRNDALVGRTVGTTDRTGFLEVNHPGGVCWGAGETGRLLVTPDIQPGDVVIANQAGPVEPDSATTRNVTAEAAFINSEGNVEVHGTAQNADGSRMPRVLMEQRIINPDFRETELNPNSRITKRDIRADSTGGVVRGIDGATGTLRYDPVDPVNNPSGTNWTAIYTGLNSDEAQLAIEGQTRVLSWMDATPAGDRLGMTIFEEDEVGGPGMGGCPAGPGPVVPPAAPNAPLLYDDNPADDDPANPTYQKYNAAGFANHVDLLDPAAPGTDLTQLHEVVAFPERDFVSVAGYAPGRNIEIVVRRPGTGIVGSARGTAGGDGVFEVNHPGGANWTGQTPDIKPGDIVDVVLFNDPDPTAAGDEIVTGGETQRVLNVRANAARIVGNRLVAGGVARNLDGSPMDLDFVEQRIINPDLKNTAVGRRDIRADVDGGRIEGIPNARGLLSAGATPGNWRVDYTGLTGAGNPLLVSSRGQTRVLGWLAADAAGERFGITIFEVGEVGGPGMGGAPPSGNESLPIVE